MLGIVAVVALATFRDYGLSWDDYAHSEYGDLLVAFYASGFADQRALSWINLYRYGGGFDLLAALAAKALPFTVFETRRLLGAAVGVLGLFVTWRAGRRIGGPPAGLIALILLATCPLYYGHMFMNPKDSPFAVAMAIFLLGLVRAFEEYPRVSIGTGALVGIGFGLSFGSASWERSARSRLWRRLRSWLRSRCAPSVSRRPAGAAGASCCRSYPRCCSPMR